MRTLPSGEPVIEFGMPCPACPAGQATIAHWTKEGKTVFYTLPHHLPGYGKWQRAGKPDPYWRMVTNMHELLHLRWLMQERRMTTRELLRLKLLEKGRSIYDRA